MNPIGLVGRLLGLEEAQSIEAVEPSLAAPWAHAAPAWVIIGCVALCGLSAWFYLKYQRRRRPGVHAVLLLLRAGALCLLVLMLAEPVLSLRVASRRRPVLWLMFDATDSMAIADEWPLGEQQALWEAVGFVPGEPPGSSKGPATQPANDASGNQESGNPQAGDAQPGNPAGQSGNAALAGESPSRMDLVKAALLKDDGAMLRALGGRSRLRAFVVERADGVRSLELGDAAGQQVDARRLAEQLTTDGEVTALGAAMADLARRYAADNVAGLIVVSDFDQNAGPPAQAAAEELAALGVPVFPVGVGPTAAADLALSLQADLHVRKDERTSVVVTLRQRGLEGQAIELRLTARAAGESGPSTAEKLIGQKSVVAEAPVQEESFDFVPDESGRFVLVAQAEPLPGETVEENNTARRELTVLDEYLRLLFVEYEPTWEWRFIKEVFHRDKLVGLQGFRTFLRSSDPRVRESNPMFLPTMSLPRSEFFKNDVIFLGDLPASALSPSFCRMTDELVRRFGGGLVVLSGPRFGPGQLAGTPLADLLPVKVEPGAGIVDREPFRLRLSGRAFAFDFMRLGGKSEAENRRAWDNLGRLAWYQPAERVHPMATVLAEHPTHTCVDGTTHQPLVAIRRVGRGEVVYLAFNETWRLRRRYGERYYRQFWGQMIHRLGLSHELGGQKRFVVRTDRRRYLVEETVEVTVEAYDNEFRAINEQSLSEQKLQAELILPVRAGGGVEDARPLQIALSRDGVFETEFPLYAPGEYRLRVTDPITDRPVEAVFQVTQVSVERQSAVRNVNLQQSLAAVHPAGRSYDLLSLTRLPEELRIEPRTEVTIEVIELGNTWLFFVLVVGVLLLEWLLRKWVNLA